MFCVYENGCESYSYKVHSLSEISRRSGLYLGNSNKLAKFVNNPRQEQPFLIFTDDTRGQIIRTAYMLLQTSIEYANNDLPGGIIQPVNQVIQKILGGINE